LRNNTSTAYVEKHFKVVLSGYINNKKNLFIAKNNFGEGIVLKNKPLPPNTHMQRSLLKDNFFENYFSSKIISLQLRV